MKRTISLTKKQRAFSDAAEDEIFFGGAAGGGKSCGQVIDALIYATKYPSSRQLIVRRTFPELERSIVPISRRYYGDVAVYTSSKHIWTFKNGSVVELGYLEAEEDVYRYQSAEYDVIRFDELTHFTESQYLYMLSRLRGSNGFPKQMKSTGNPGGVGHAFVKKRFIDTNGKTKGGRTVRFIPSRVTDNCFLMKADPDYVKRLSELPEREKRRLLDGDWDFCDGSYFPEFSRDVHIVKPFDISNMTLFRSLDYGLDMTACLWWAVGSDGKMYIYRELYKKGLTLSEAAREIISASPQYEKIIYTVASPDLWNRRQESGTSGAEILWSAGLTGLIPADDGRVRGFRLIRELISHNGREPTLRFFDGCCPNLVRCLPLLTHSAKNPEDASDSPHEITHAPEALRYGAMSRPHYFEEKQKAYGEYSFGDPFAMPDGDTPSNDYLYG